MGELWNRLTERQKKMLPWLAVILVAGVGMLLVQPASRLEVGGTAREQPPVELQSEAEDTLTRELTAVLNALLGGKRCTVFLTMDRGPALRIAYNVTEEVRTGPEGVVEKRLTSTPVILRSDAERREVPLILEQVEPQVRGVLVVLDAPPDAELRLAVTRAVATALQVPMYRIEVAFKK